MNMRKYELWYLYLYLYVYSLINFSKYLIDRNTEKGNMEDEIEPTPRIEEFFLWKKKKNRPTFDGRVNLSEDKKWIRALERIFKLLRCDD